MLGSHWGIHPKFAVIKKIFRREQCCTGLKDGQYDQMKSNAFLWIIGKTKSITAVENPVFGVSKKGIPNPICLATEVITNTKILRVASSDMIQWKLFTVTFFITATFFTTSIVFAQMYQFSLNLNSLQQKFSLTSNYLETNSVVVKRVDCTFK